ncbi:SAM-dependent methyltransferase [Methylomarinum sp. Ch1-1]|uniref:SAM-dependent methyltransferase n=1 Tax=Methylomarinum roseum TaxID=3067653 RepID=A0AAU7NW33_9GAMM|nr:SAM-dependent methyltransferase [Methylomarinum sp. Ch1-1]MDP4522730.1 SAM-dependent methyltransferase [Methylomarinum sp. Ch1-1]
MSPLRIRYQTIEFDNVDIHLRTLRDRQQYLDVDGVAAKLGISSATWPLFGIVWDSSEVLAHLMYDYKVAGKRILEVGCGIALSSLVLNHRHADITATDYHPEAEHFLLENVRLNKGNAIPFVRTGWGDQDSDLGEFDLLIGSDLLYESEHVELLAGFIDHHAKPHCDVILVDPGRGHHARFSKKMIGLGYSHSQNKPDNVDYLSRPFRGQVLQYQR